MVSRFAAEQLSWPRGVAGWLTRRLMNRGNAQLNGYALAQLDVSDQDSVLEVGFGGGVLLPRLLARAAFVQGIDRSLDVVAAARRRFSGDIRTGRAKFDQGTIEDLPLPAASVDKAITVHTVYFWRSLEGGMTQFARVLRPGGRLVIGFLPKTHMDLLNMPAEVFTPREPEQIAESLRGAGFGEIALCHPHTSKWLVATAIMR